MLPDMFARLVGLNALLRELSAISVFCTGFSFYWWERPCRDDTAVVPVEASRVASVIGRK